MNLDLGKVDGLIAEYHDHKEQMIGLLQDIQAEYNYLPRPALEKVSKQMEVPLAQLYGIATFYKAFSLKPRGKHCLSVCLGTACHVRGGQRILERLEKDLAVHQGETTTDNLFTLITVNCVGACALGPVVVVDKDYHGHMNSSKVPGVLSQYGQHAGGGK
jgi:NADH:ubiquinone oxidoreductase subunit E